MTNFFVHLSNTIKQVQHLFNSMVVIRLRKSSNLLVTFFMLLLQVFHLVIISHKSSIFLVLAIKRCFSSVMSLEDWFAMDSSLTSPSAFGNNIADCATLRWLDPTCKKRDHSIIQKSRNILNDVNSIRYTIIRKTQPSIHFTSESTSVLMAISACKCYPP